MLRSEAGPLDHDLQPAEAHRAAGANVDAVHGGDAPHDRPAQAAAALPAAEHAEEALAEALQVGSRQAGAAVLDAQPGASRVGCASATLAPRPVGAVAQRVVDQVAHQHRQQRRVAAHRARRFGRPDLDRLPPLEGPRRQLGGHAPRRARQVDRASAGAAPASSRDSVSICSTSRAARSQPCQRRVQRMAARRVVGLAQRHLGLRADRRDRGAQFVRRIGGEAALGLHQRGDALEQAVQRIEHRLHLGRRVRRRRPGCQRLRLALGQRAPELAQRRDAPVHRPPDRQRQQRQRHQPSAAACRAARPTGSTLRESMLFADVAPARRARRRGSRTRASAVPPICTVREAGLVKPASLGVRPSASAGALAERIASRPSWKTWKATFGA